MVIGEEPGYFFFADLEQIVETVAADANFLGVEVDSFLEFALFLLCGDRHQLKIWNNYDFMVEKTLKVGIVVKSNKN